MVENVSCIGGPLDGKTIEFDTALKGVDVPVLMTGTNKLDSIRTIEYIYANGVLSCVKDDAPEDESQP